MSMIALSTTFLPREPFREVERRERLLAFEVEGFELDPGITETELPALMDEIRGSGRELTSLLNFTPSSAAFPASRQREAARLLSSLDADERRVGIAATVRTIEWAARLEIPTVIIEGGSLSKAPTPEPYAVRAARIRPGVDPWARFRRDLHRFRRSAPVFRDRLCLSLDRILREAERLDVDVALVNPRDGHALPNVVELRQILAEFRGAPLGSWLDVAHAQHQEWLGLEAAAVWREVGETSRRGYHLSDARGLQTGLPPGEGDVHFRDAVADSPANLPLVVKCQETDSDERIVASISRLRETLFDEGTDPLADAVPRIGRG